MSRTATILPGCFAGDDSADLPRMSPRGRAARLLAGAGFLGAAGVALHARGLPGGTIALAAAVAVPAWMGATHLVASGSGYQGCPELGAIPSLFTERPMATNCAAWQAIDALIGA
jgi:hypothetical protein